MRTLGQFFCLMLLCLGVAAQDHASHIQTHSVALVTGLGDLHHPVSTKNQQAQQFFDQGLRFIYAFNHDEAAHSFQHAAELDPKLAMAYWGVAEAVGPNYNDPADPDRYKQAHNAVQKAVDLSEEASTSDQAYIQALARRFPANPKSDLKKAAEDYRDAMRQVVTEFPDDLDAATLFAEAGMNLHPWGLWHVDGTPEAGTEEIVSTLESVMKRDPNHLGAVHYYIHAVEASPTPERALAGANKLAALAPGAGHIVHMPAHVYIRTGDYEAAVKTNEEAAAVDRGYIKSTGAQGIYPMMYYSHNLHFIAMCAAMNGNYAESRKNADLLVENVGPHVKNMPPLEGFMTIPVAVEIRFHHWNELLKMPQPDSSMKTATVFWHFGRGLALAGTGNIAEAEAEYKIVSDAEAATPPDVIFQMPINNKAKDIMKIAKDVLGAKIAAAKKDNGGAIAMLQDAVAIQDTLKYGEPPDWFYPVRESLGGMLLVNGDAAGAERVFREDLDRNLRNPRSLWGLHQALMEQKRGYDAGFIQKQFESSWKGGAGNLKLDDLV
ncbi:MAG: tetratricopeptide repeat protein [Candidatus Sulfotelmatobacter sp.]|jgi:tetratricopeptide (TPR) repeat protein